MPNYNQRAIRLCGAAACAFAALTMGCSSPEASTLASTEAIPTSVPAASVSPAVSAKKAGVEIASTLGDDTTKVREDRQDYVQVQTTRRGVGLSTFAVQWTSGARAEIPPAAAEADVFFASLYPVTVPNLDDPKKDPSDLDTKLWIPKGASGTAISLELRPAIPGMAVILTTGAKPGLTFTGLPQKSIDLTLTTSRTGVDVITTGNGCKKSAKRQKMKYEGTNAPGRAYKGVLSDPNTPSCRGLPRGTKLR